MANKVLVVDDEKAIVKGIRFSLEQDGYEVTAAYDGEEALTLAQENQYDIILLDLMLPRMSGLDVCQQIREFSNVPIIMLTAKGEDMDKIMGLEYGADDYITKPFNILEVKARIKAILRRSRRVEESVEKSRIVQAGNLKMDCDSRRVFIGEREVNLTAKEFDVLQLLVFNPNKVYSRENLLNIVWGYEYPGDVRTVDVHIRRLTGTHLVSAGNGLDDLPVLLRHVLCSFEIIIVDVPEEEHQLLQLLHHVDQDLVVAGIYDHPVELRIVPDHILHIPGCDRFIVMVGDLSKFLHLDRCHSGSREVCSQALQVLPHLQDLYHVLCRYHGSICAASRLDGYKAFLLELTDGLPDRCPADAHLLGEVDLHHPCSRNDRSGQDLYLQFFIDHFPQGLMILDVKIQHDGSLP